MWCGSVAFKGQCLSCTHSVVDVRLLQVVAILLLLSLAVFQCGRWEKHGDMAAHKQFVLASRDF